MRVAITGATGLIGKALTADLEQDGHTVLRLVRDRSRVTARAAYWSPAEGVVDTEALSGVDAVVHLAGEPIGGALRWTESVKTRIRESRRQGTDVLARALASMDDKPAVLVSASAVGYYGNRGDEVLTEASDPGVGFLPEVCQVWESAAAPAAEAGIRVVHPRTGVVLSADGGALERMLPPFKLGVGGKIGDGSQWFPWISLEDEVRALRHLIDGTLDGPVNLAGPDPVTNAQFTKALGEVLGRPTALSVPAFAIKAALGEMGERLVLDSTRVVPSRLVEDGFAFVHTDVVSALRWALDHQG